MDYQVILAKCFVAMAEVDYDLKAWHSALELRKLMDRHLPVEGLTRRAAIPQEVRSGTVSN
jgi:hypothetical protein